MAKGRVYIVRNPAFWDVFKIGFTSQSSVEKRGLNAANVPQDFMTLAEYECDNPEKIENLFHATFKNYRHYADSGRETEFFYVKCLNEALSWMKTIKGLADVTEEALDEEEEVRDSAGYDKSKAIAPRSPNTAFENSGVPVGAVLTYKRDPSKKCKVLDEKNKVEYKGEKYTAAGIVNKWRKDEGGLSSHSVNGFAYLLYNGEPIYKGKS
jgi:hypothetical protein